MQDRVRPARAFEVGRTIGGHSHGALAASDIDAVVATVGAIEEARADDRDDDAAALALAYWDGYTVGVLDAPEDEPRDRIEQAFATGAFGMDLYQRLRGLHRAVDRERAVGAWVDRVLEVTREERDHLETHR